MLSVELLRVHIVYIYNKPPYFPDPPVGFEDPSSGGGYGLKIITMTMTVSFVFCAAAIPSEADLGVYGGRLTRAPLASCIIHLVLCCSTLDAGDPADTEGALVAFSVLVDQELFGGGGE